MTALSVSNLTINRGDLSIVRNASLVVDEGSITVLLGANGAGKTTLMEGIAGALPCKRGTVTLAGAEIQGLDPYRRAKSGLSLIEQGRAVFLDLTVEENLEAVCAEGADASEAFALFPELEKRRTVRSGLLSGGEQQMLLIARALLMKPRVMLIDEMSLGLAPLVVQRLMRLVRDLAAKGLSILLVEQFASLALAVGQRAYVLRHGEIAYDGTCRELHADPTRLHDLYFGT